MRGFESVRRENSIRMESCSRNALLAKAGVGGVERVPLKPGKNGFFTVCQWRMCLVKAAKEGSVCRRISVGTPGSGSGRVVGVLTGGLPFSPPHDASMDRTKEAAHIRDKRNGVFEYNFTVFIFRFSYSTVQIYIYFSRECSPGITFTVIFNIISNNMIINENK